MGAPKPNDTRMVGHGDYTKPVPTKYRDFGGIGAGASGSRPEEDYLLASEKRNYSTQPQHIPQRHPHDRIQLPPAPRNDYKHFTSEDGGDVDPLTYENNYSYPYSPTGQIPNGGGLISTSNRSYHEEQYSTDSRNHHHRRPHHHAPPPHDYYTHQPQHPHPHGHREPVRHQQHEADLNHEYELEEYYDPESEERAFRATEEWVMRKSGDPERYLHERGRHGHSH